jgi:hypothetical protein
MIACLRRTPAKFEALGGSRRSVWLGCHAVIAFCLTLGVLLPAAAQAPPVGVRAPGIDAVKMTNEVKAAV